MKTLKLVTCTLGLVVVLLIAVQSNAQAPKEKYTIVDLYSGETMDIYYDTVNWRTMNRVSNAPVDYYIIRYTDATMAPDTIHGVTGIVVNNLIMKNNDGKWMFDDAKVKWDGNELKMKDRYGRKVKWDQGVLKIKDWNSKYKSESGDDAKFKEEWDKIKWKEGDVKVETGTQKAKVKQ